MDKRIANVKRFFYISKQSIQPIQSNIFLLHKESRLVTLQIMKEPEERKKQQASAQEKTLASRTVEASTVQDSVSMMTPLEVMKKIQEKLNKMKEYSQTKDPTNQFLLSQTIPKKAPQGRETRNLQSVYSHLPFLYRRSLCRK